MTADEVRQVLRIRAVAMEAWKESRTVIEPGVEDFEAALEKAIAEAAERGEL